MTEERVIFNEGEILVSTSRVNLSGTTYSTSNLTSVSKRSRAPKTGCALALMITGGFLVLGALCSLGGDKSAAFSGLLLAAFLIAGGWLWFKSLKPTHLVVFSSASGQMEALSSQDEALIDRVVSAVNQAIVERG